MWAEYIHWFLSHLNFDQLVNFSAFGCQIDAPQQGVFQKQADDNFFIINSRKIQGQFVYDKVKKLYLMIITMLN